MKKIRAQKLIEVNDATHECLVKASASLSKQLETATKPSHVSHITADFYNRFLVPELIDLSCHKKRITEKELRARIDNICTLVAYDGGHFGTAAYVALRSTDNIALV